MYKHINLKKKFYSSNDIKPKNIYIQPQMIKYGQIIYSLRTIFTILPDSFEELKKFNHGFNIYYPINSKYIPNKFDLPTPSLNDILINNLEEISYHVCKKLELDINNHTYKFNIFNQELNLVTSNEQLSIPDIKNNIIYIKVSNADIDEERKYIDRCDNHNDPKSKFIITTSKIFKEENKELLFNNKEIKSRFINSLTSEILSNEKNITTNYLTEQTDEKNKEIENKLNQDYISRKNSKKSSIISMESENKIDYDISQLILNTHSKLNTTNSILNLPKIPLLHHKVKISIEDKDIIIPRNKIQIKELKLINDLQSPLGIISMENDENELTNDDEEDYIQDNLTLFYEINDIVSDFIINKTNKFITDSEAGYFIFLKLNFIFINEMANFPIIQLKKRFLFCAFLSRVLQETQLQFHKDFYSLCKSEKNENFSFVLKMKNFREIINEFYKEFLIITKNKLQFMNMMNSYDETISISYLFIILFILFHKKLSFNIDKEIVFLILKSIKIPFGTSLNFQTFCNYLIFLTRNKYISFDKKFLFLKELVNNLSIHPKRVILSQKLVKSFLIKKNDLKVIIDNDIVSINYHKNIHLVPIVEKIYNKIINYYT